MSKRYIFPDSTCYFSQSNLLDCIKNPREDFLWIHEYWWNITWGDSTINDFCATLPLKNYSDTIIVRDFLLKEREHINNTIKELISLGVADYISSDNERIDGFLKYKNTSKEQYIKNRIEVLNPNNNIIKECNLLPTVDVDILTLYTLTGCELKTSNEKLEHYLIDLKRKKNKSNFLEKSKSLKYIDVCNIDKYLESKESYIDKSNYKGCMECLVIFGKTLISMSNFGIIYTLQESIYKLANVFEYWDEYKFTMLKKNISASEEVNDILYLFYEYRLNMPPKIREL